MPVFPSNRQPDALAWFDSLNGQALLALELNAVRAAFVARPAQPPWLWIAAAASSAAQGFPVPPRSLVLHRQAQRLEGSFRGDLPLPLADESIGNLILQHALDDGGDALLDECARVLEPGGRLWLFTLNPWSPYRLRWRSSGLRARALADWHLRLRRSGLQPCAMPLTRMGPRWRQSAPTATADDYQAGSRLSAIHVLQVEKRSAALIPPAPVTRRWQAGAATA